MTDSKIKYIKYTNTLKQQRTIMDGYCSTKYNMTNISTKSKKQLKTRDSVIFNTRKKNYKKYNQDHMKLLDDSIEFNNMLITQNYTKNNNMDDIINTVEKDWIIC